MEWSIINASHWERAEDHDFIEYKTGADPQLFQGFAWLRFNKHTKEITAARDHFGQEPFYYSRYNQHFIFGSSIPDIVSHFDAFPHFSSHLIRDCFLRYPADDPTDDPPYSIETYHEGIFRLTPGHYLEITQGSIKERPFWKLDASKPKLFYSDSREYVKHFEHLLNEAIMVTTSGANHLALEFSGGIDSSMLFIASQKNELKPTLFTHIPPQKRPPTEEDHNVAYLVNQFDWKSKHIAVNAAQFEPISVFKRFAQIFAGPPPNLNCVLSNNLHQAILDRDHRFLISGYGGDDSVSLIFPEKIAYSAEALYNYEIDILQGKRSHEMRMRLEYAAVAAKSVGFRYIYPLLYPPLIEYCFSLPMEQKFKNGTMRCTAREYLLQQVQHMRFSTKTGAVVPDTMQKCRDYYRLGKFEEHFKQLPFEQYIAQRTTDDDKLLLKIHAYMAKQAQLMQHDRRRTIKTCSA